MTVLFGTSASLNKSKETAYRLLAFALQTHWGLTAVPPIGRAQGGKPYFPALPSRHFNLSHTKGLCLCALSDHPVGVDIEVIRPRRASLPQWCMSQAEYQTFDGTWADFYRIWTLKEAYCKYQGRSIYPPDLIPAPPPCPHACYAGDGWRAALCGRAPLPEHIQWVSF